MTEHTAIDFPLFDFMDVRAPQALSAHRRRRGFINDQDAPKPGPVRTAGLPPDTELPHVSRMAQVVLNIVDSWAGDPGDPAALASLRTALAANHASLSMEKLTPPGVVEEGTREASFSELETGTFLVEGQGDGQRLYLLPDHPGRLEPTVLFDRIDAAGRTIDRQLASGTWDLPALLAALQTDLGQPVDVFAWGPAPRNDDSWLLAHRTLFDALYLMYVTRRWTGFKNLEPLTRALQTLHVVSVLGADLLVGEVRKAKKATPAQGVMLDNLVRAWAELRRPFSRREAKWEVSDLAPWDRFPAISSLDDLFAHQSASPVIHQLFAKLFWHSRPFNDIKPIGCGDLKVVRDRLDRYVAVDIADIQNVMKGETRRRTHVRSETLETTFSLEQSDARESTHDTQTTERFEVKSAAERVLRDQQALNVNANASLTAGGAGSVVQFTASAGLSYASSKSFEDHATTSRAFARDVVDHAVERVETKRAVSRSTTTTIETKERNFHELTSPDGHTSAIYQWVEAEYTAQVFSYGRRTMFEFVVPEPAAFWVASRLAGHETEIEVPQPPKKPAEEKVNLGFTSNQIDSRKFATLSLEYGLRDVQEPPAKKRLVLRRSDNGSMIFDNGAADLPDIENPHMFFDAKLEGAPGYTTESVEIMGGWQFRYQAPKDGSDDNGLKIRVNGVEVLNEESYHQFRPGEAHLTHPLLSFVDDNATVAFQFKNKGQMFSLTLAFNLTRPDALYEAWQHRVFDLVEDAENKRVKQRNAEREVEYESQLAQYRAAVAEVRATPIVELLAGRSQAENRRVIDAELKKHCITMIAKEFDTVGDDDELEKLQPLGTREVTTDRTRLKVTEHPTLEGETTASFEVQQKKMEYPAANLPEAKRKGRLVKFLDQAFEWEKLSYLFYDYFYANMPRWVELVNRDDAADAVWTAFLSAGQARVLVAVTPKHEVAVQHFLDTREPWEGTDADPVLDDPLFVPLFDEIRSRTADRSGGTACGDPWTYRVPVPLPYLRGSSTDLPDLEKERQEAAGGPP
jgi:hypothetical protein